MNESFNTILKFPFSFILKYFLRNHVNYFKFHFCYILKERIIMINTRHHSKGFIYIFVHLFNHPDHRVRCFISPVLQGRKERHGEVREVK